MVAYSFKAQFVAPILAGTKRQTIRSPRKHHAKWGDQLQLYYAMRTKQCRLIARAVSLGTADIRIWIEGGRVESLDTGTAWTTPEELDAFARLDGFEDWRAMRLFWREAHPTLPIFTGVMVRWFELQPPDAAEALPRG